MTISGFTFIKNATKLYIPLRESILSVLPLVDEFVIAVGDNDLDDTTVEVINSINADKIKVIHTKWDTKKYVKNTEFARQTDIAKEACKGDWLVYIQADEAIHEQDYAAIQEAMDTYLNDSEVEGLLFKYRHFWGDYNHFHKSHNWYPREIRIIKNSSQIHSWRDAQSFRKFDSFDYSPSDYNSERGQKLTVKLIDAYIYHYGYVRPPHMMSYKSQVMHSSYHGKKKADEIVAKQPKEFDYGPLQKLLKFSGTHPKVMEPWMSKFDWEEKLQYEGKRNLERPMHKHEKLKYRVVTWIEQNILGGRMIGGFRNYHLKK